MKCPKCSKTLIQLQKFPYIGDDGVEYEQPEYVCNFDGTRVPVDEPRLLAAYQRRARSRADEANELQRQVEKRNDLSNQLLRVSGEDKAEIEEQIRLIEEELSSSKESLERNRSKLLSSLNKNTEDLVKLEYQPKSSLIDAEIKGLGLYEDENKKELHRIESLLAIIECFSPERK